MQSNVKTAGAEKMNNFTITPFAGERERWEEYERAIWLMIKRNIDVPTEWNDFLYTEFPGVPNRPDEFIYPEEETKEEEIRQQVKNCNNDDLLDITRMIYYL